MVRIDDRTPEQMRTHRCLVVATDRFLSRWGHAATGPAVCAWACDTLTDAYQCRDRLAGRKEMLRVRIVHDGKCGKRGIVQRFSPKGAAHFHIYVYKAE